MIFSDTGSLLIFIGQTVSIVLSILILYRLSVHQSRR